MNMRSHILIVDDEPPIREVLKDFVEMLGHEGETAASAEDGLELFQKRMPDLVLSDLVLPGMSGIDLLRAVKQIDPQCHVVLMTGYASGRTAIEAMGLGADDYITKPLRLDELKVIIEKALEARAAEKGRQRKELVLDGIIGESPAITKVLDMVERLSRTSTTTVLILGASGTGKEVVARAIHKNSPTADYPFISVSCAAIPSALLEAELFGYEKGAFTDAKTQKKGLLELADKGTLFLDEMGLMGLDLQAKLLNILETQTFRRIGGTKEIKVSLRFIAATNEDLDKAVEKGAFREDLYYRLHVIPIYLPQLRERGNDVLLIAEHYLRHYGREHGNRHFFFTAETKALLMSYHWPGNVRELKNVIERAVLMAQTETILPEDLPINRRARPTREAEMPSASQVNIEATGDIQVRFPPWGISLEEVERRIIAEALRETRGNVSEAAHLLHISRDTLRYRIKKFELESGLSESEGSAEEEHPSFAGRRGVVA